jgi:hypothetical protein
MYWYCTSTRYQYKAVVINAAVTKTLCIPVALPVLVASRPTFVRLQISNSTLFGKLNYYKMYLEKSTRQVIAFAVHQCARYSMHSDPKQSHSSAAVQYYDSTLVDTS